jgi:hypothetical protein
LQLWHEAPLSPIQILLSIPSFAVIVVRVHL